MNKATVDLINELGEILASIRERVVNEGEFLESDHLFIEFYNKFVDKAFNVEKGDKKYE